MAKRLHVPKKIGGVKVPKPIRKGPVADFLGTTFGQALLAEVLVVAGGALLAKRTDPESAVGEFLRHPMAQLHGVGESAVQGAGEVKESIGDGAGRFADALAAAVNAFQSALGQEGTREVEHDEGGLRDDESQDAAQPGAYANEGHASKKKNKHAGSANVQGH